MPRFFLSFALLSQLWYPESKSKREIERERERERESMRGKEGRGKEEGGKREGRGKEEGDDREIEGERDCVCVCMCVNVCMSPKKTASNMARPTPRRQARPGRSLGGWWQAIRTTTDGQPSPAQPTSQPASQAIAH
ncbi:uncharacterized protein K452DRAFT_14731 [Aplosporella prunicola CBS 121167]|uniref:Uncharacterized protein n=1 Tax=Aplosporella prunicola CBS 121167 TaxID=1176127 RepID=A0A6A6BI79_9PEZI|nr:uncharacterized protein K452DRAFT_14731 [Aplosporella prunicola CBS 121167]KAF2143045.1 hypothetical protein K452DRAFT_14731 [Aplosporella prunicola CBS 121167]